MVKYGAKWINKETNTKNIMDIIMNAHWLQPTLYTSEVFVVGYDISTK